MHEFSIVQNILSIAEENALEIGAKVVYAIEMEVGELSGVDFEALDFAMQNTIKTGIFENAKLEVSRIEGYAKCRACSQEFLIKDLYTPCPVCGKYDHKILKGQELKITAIKFD